MNLNCLIVDDEPFAHKVIERYMQDIQILQLQKNCYNAVEALQALHEHPVDLIFLDIQMPKLTGLSFIKSLPHKPQVILTTAYKEYALEGYELDVCDYILKPFSFERFLLAVNKAAIRIEREHLPAQEERSHERHTSSFIAIKADKKLHKVELQDILYFESYGSYVKVHLKDRVLVTLESLKNLESTLPKEAFVRIHKSFLVSSAKINCVEGNTVHIGLKQLPVGAMYKLNLNKSFKGV